MKFFVKSFLLLFVLVGGFSVFADEDEKEIIANPALQTAQTKVGELNTLFAKDECYDPEKISTKKCQAHQKKIDFWKAKEREAIPQDYNQDSCKAVHDDFVKQERDVLKECKEAGLGGLDNCAAQSKICNDPIESSSRVSTRRGRSTRGNAKVCQSSILATINQNDEKYKSLTEDYENAKNDQDNQQNKLNQQQQELINKQGQLETAKANAEKVVRDAERANTESGQQAVQDILNMQLQIDQAEFAVEDLRTQKSTELTNAKNTIEESLIACYETAVTQYNSEYEACLIRKNRRISEGKYSSNSLKTLFSSNRKGSCTQTNKQEWYKKYQDDCTQNDGYKSRIARIKQQYEDTAKNINTLIERQEAAVARIRTSLEVFRANNKQINEIALKEQEANLNTASNIVKQIQSEIQLLIRQIRDTEAQLLRAQTQVNDIDRNKLEVTQVLLEDKKKVGGHNSDDIEKAKLANDAFASIDFLYDTPKKTTANACCNGDDEWRKNTIICAKVKPEGRPGATDNTSPSTTTPAPDSGSQ